MYCTTKILHFYYKTRVCAAMPTKELIRRSWVGGDEASVYTMRELNQQTARVIGEIETSGRPAFITRHGRFIAVITPLARGQIESRVLAAMAQEINEESGQ
jgi:antitoxin (DNA-binding transcriptional repressor) of toxin-antitoxin stability system